ncbi:aldose epimerase family protein [Eubacterium oxidoreducens]|uniref:Aldose 1-epimerase n=1 Tax=Eubacterium oxidoreducens TaxID=1732 RepID=A0A1G6AE27_EUBOX|nr:aldose epimerase family protein [Eubacterium oxidoreducens]SDB06667.1 aldose 1-epimerase [Eubacterium oxidoreducens]
MTKVKVLQSIDYDMQIYEMTSERVRVVMTNVGCHLLSIFTPDREGKMADILLGYQEITHGMDDGQYLGALCGRVAGRIAGASFRLNDKTYQLSVNEGENHLHGGASGFDKKIFSTEILPNGIRFSYISEDGEEGYPGRLKLQAEYILRDNILYTNFVATTDEDTIVNIAGHPYFNLSGGTEEIYTHELKIDANEIACIDSKHLPTGEYINVEGTPFDFHEYHEIKENLAKPHPQLALPGGFDHAFMLGSGFEQIALRHRLSGRMVEIMTNLPCAVIYTGNPKGIAIETQYLPDSIHIEEESQVILRSNQEYHARTAYCFEVMQEEVEEDWKIH